MIIPALLMQIFFDVVVKLLHFIGLYRLYS